MALLTCPLANTPRCTQESIVLNRSASPNFNGRVMNMPGIPTILVLSIFDKLTSSLLLVITYESGYELTADMKLDGNILHIFDLKDHT